MMVPKQSCPTLHLSVAPVSQASSACLILVVTETEPSAVRLSASEAFGRIVNPNDATIRQPRARDIGITLYPSVLPKLGYQTAVRESRSLVVKAARPTLARRQPVAAGFTVNMRTHRDSIPIEQTIFL